ncbi:MAG TPA: hypothetical protein PLL80_01245 [Candidatus Pacearchaeota archaeon]|nr:hypothetical protein [Candidatus Pacearchaeota archaeon]HOK94095.1 hypothetical protein [Candidatus Pacearchaeota archaeon]HPO75223.1 hypothetical protein [Candidatus Pacearchaeota archaeon]
MEQQNTEEKNIKTKKNINFWIPVSIVLFLLLLTSIWFNGFGLKNLVFKNSDKVAEKALDFINKNMLAEGYTASLIESKQLENGLYEIRFKIEDQNFTSYVSSDGNMLFLEGIEMTSANSSSTEEETQDIPKSDKPSVQLFVMSYCPYGLQAEKMYLPVLNLLKNKVEMSIHFVNYAMHEKKEIDENLRQYCIQKEEPDKYSNYLNCFVKAGDYENCLKEAQIDETKLDSCITQTDQEYNITSQYNDKNTWLGGQYPKFDVETELNEEYNVQGSPTIVINGKVVNINPRSPEKFKEVICQAFNNPPEECSQKLSEEAASTGFEEESGSTSGGSCE